MTKSPAPLIIILGGSRNWVLGSGPSDPPTNKPRRTEQMRIQIYKEADGVSRFLVVPNRRARLSPIAVQGTDKEAVRLELAAVIATVSDRETPKDTQQPLL